eukprot:504292-Amphidinium_carterae.1
MADQALAAIRNMRLVPVDTLVMKPPESSEYRFDDLPVKPLDTIGGKKLSYTIVLEVTDLTEKPDVEVFLDRLTHQNRVGDEPWALKSEPPTCQYVWGLVHANGGWKLYKYMHFSKKIFAMALMKMCFGKLYVLDCKNNKMPPAGHHMICNHVGLDVPIMGREFEEVEEPKDKRITSRAQIAQAIDRINLKGQTGVGKNEAMRWAW